MVRAGAVTNDYFCSLITDIAALFEVTRTSSITANQQLFKLSLYPNKPAQLISSFIFSLQQTAGEAYGVAKDVKLHKRKRKKQLKITFHLMV